jgi:hypothetical protein
MYFSEANHMRALCVAMGFTSSIRIKALRLRVLCSKIVEIFMSSVSVGTKAYKAIDEHSVKL